MYMDRTSSVAPFNSVKERCRVMDFRDCFGNPANGLYKENQIRWGSSLLVLNVSDATRSVTLYKRFRQRIEDGNRQLHDTL